MKYPNYVVRSKTWTQKENKAILTYKAGRPMARKSPQIELIEIGGDQFPDLHTAQRFARSLLASSLADTTRRLLADGALININGNIIPNPERITQA